MRIIAGKWKRLRLIAPQNAVTRPTADRLRESLFNILNSYFIKNGQLMAGMNVLDVFAGSGALGFEALSRGAASATFIERDTRACESIRENIRYLKAESATILIQSDVFALRAPQRTYDIIFLDPPYSKGFCEKALVTLAEQGWFSDKALFIVETCVRDILCLNPEKWQTIMQRIIGSTSLTLLKM